VVLGLLFWGIAPVTIRENTTTRLRDFTSVVRRNWQLIYFAAASLIIAFSLGMAAGVFQYFPYKTMKEAVNALQDWNENWRHNLRTRPDQYLKPSQYAGQGVVLHKSQKAHEGVTFITSLFDGKLGMRLVDMEGAEIHKWHVPFQEIWPDESKRPHDWDSEIHGALLYPNGDIVFNIEWKTLVRIDKCSRLIWSLPLGTHHSVYEDDEGNLWVPGRKWRNKSLDELRYISAPFSEEFILKVSPDGKLLEEISIIDVIYDSGYDGLLFADRRVKPEHTKYDHGDLTHVNDIEVLGKDISDAYDLFDTGDIIVSMRILNALIVIDPETLRIKWASIGPFLRQHDPDFLSNGRILVFDNRWGDSNEKIFSRIIQLDPVTQEVVVVFQGDNKNPFFTSLMGKHQYFENGNLLITETMAGRAFEVTAEGEVVWSYINRWDSERVIAISEATRYPLSYASFGKDPCQ
jgi:hypothetical protein